MAVPKIKRIFARQILDSRGNPTVECDVSLSNGSFGRAAVPSGASTGSTEAFELRDGGKEFGGLGVMKAVSNVNGEIFKALRGKPTVQRKVDAVLIKLDGTENKSRLGANATLAVSLALARAIAGKKELYESLGKGRKIPTPLFNVINGGKHAGGKLAIQEFIIIPEKFGKFSEKLRAGAEIYQMLKRKLKERYGVSAINVGDEGGFAPPIDSTEEAVQILLESIDSAGYSGKVFLGFDSAATTFYDKRSVRYLIDGKSLSREEMIAYYSDLVKQHPEFVYLEDILSEDDFDGFSAVVRSMPAGVMVVGDDLYTTNIRRMAVGIEKKSTTALLLKVNQIGTLTEAIEAFALAKKSGWKVIVSHRSGETTDDFISDLAVGLGAEYLKAGAPCRGERLAKYNRLLRIEEKFGK